MWINRITQSNPNVIPPVHNNLLHEIMTVFTVSATYIVLHSYIDVLVPFRCPTCTILCANKPVHPVSVHSVLVALVCNIYDQIQHRTKYNMFHVCGLSASVTQATDSLKWIYDRCMRNWSCFAFMLKQFWQHVCFNISILCIAYWDECDVNSNLRGNSIEFWTYEQTTKI